MSDQSNASRDEERPGGHGVADEAGIVDQQDALLHEMHEMEAGNEERRASDD